MELHFREDVDDTELIDAGLRIIATLSQHSVRNLNSLQRVILTTSRGAVVQRLLMSWVNSDVGTFARLETDIKGSKK